MVTWKWACNTPKNAGIYSIKDNRTGEIKYVSSPRLRTELKRVYEQLDDPESYDIIVRFIIQDIFGKAAIDYLEPFRQSYIKIENGIQENIKEYPKTSWWKARKKDTPNVVYLGETQQGLERFIVNILKGYINDYDIIKYYDLWE